MLPTVSRARSLSTKRVMRIVFLIAAAISLIACATPSRYQWDGYDQQLYSYYKNPATAQDFRLRLETYVQAIEKNGQKPPPGMFAEVGTLYLEGGDVQTAVSYYRKEAAAWPESEPLMKVMVARLEKKTPANQDVEKKSE